MRYAALGLGHVVVAPATFSDSTCPHDVDNMLTQATSCQHTVNILDSGSIGYVTEMYWICCLVFHIYILASVENPIETRDMNVSYKFNYFEFENCAIRTLHQTLQSLVLFGWSSQTGLNSLQLV